MRNRNLEIAPTLAGLTAGTQVVLEYLRTPIRRGLPNPVVPFHRIQTRSRSLGDRLLLNPQCCQRALRLNESALRNG